MVCVRLFVGLFVCLFTMSRRQWYSCGSALPLNRHYVIPSNADAAKDAAKPWSQAARLEEGSIASSFHGVVCLFVC
jgi:hypothetical protein